MFPAGGFLGQRDLVRQRLVPALGGRGRWRRVERGGLKRSLLPAVELANTCTLRVEPAQTSLCATKTEGTRRRNFLMPLKLAVSLLSQEIIPKIEAVPASLVQEKTAGMTSLLFYFTGF